MLHKSTFVKLRQVEMSVILQSQTPDSSRENGNDGWLMRSWKPLYLQSTQLIHFSLMRPNLTMPGLHDIHN